MVRVSESSRFLAYPMTFGPTWSPQGDAIAFERDNVDFLQSAIFVKELAGAASPEMFLRRGPATAVFRPQSPVPRMK